MQAEVDIQLGVPLAHGTRSNEVRQERRELVVAGESHSIRIGESMRISIKISACPCCGVFAYSFREVLTGKPCRMVDTREALQL